MQFNNLRKQLQEKTLTPAEKKKREEVAKAIERDNPNMPMGMKMAIATKTAKRVAEAVEENSTHHRVYVTVSNPNHPVVWRRNEGSNKTIRVSAGSKEEAVSKAKSHYQSQGYKVHSAEAKAVAEAKETSYTGKGNHRPGWMLKADPELAKKFKEKEETHKARVKAYGNPAAGKSVKEEVVDESKSTASKPYYRIVGTISPELKKRLAAADEKRRENARQLMQRPTKPTSEESQKEEVEGVAEQDEPRYRPRREDPHAYEKHRELQGKTPARTMSDQEKAERSRQMAADLERIRKKSEQVSAVMAMHDRMHSKMYGPKKEEVEHIEELKKSTIGNYMNKTVDPVYGMPKPTDKLKQRLAGMSRAHQRIIGKKPTSN